MPRVQNRRGTAAALASVNPTPLAGELVWESDTNRIKIGDGTSTYTTLSYVGATSPTFTGQATFDAGTVSSPAIISATGTADCGIYWPNTDAIAIATSGIQRLRITNGGSVLIGTQGTRYTGPSAGVALQIEGTTAGGGGQQQVVGSTTASVSPQLILGRHRGAIGESTAVVSGDSLGLIRWNAGDGTDVSSQAANIEAFADGGIGTDDTPGRIVFRTSSPGGNTPAERVRITSAGLVGIATASPTATLDVSADTIRLRTARTPASASAAGNAGDICWDASFLYIAVAANTWRRIAHSSW